MTELERNIKEFRTSAWLITLVHRKSLGDRYAQRIIDLYNRKFEGR